MDKSKADWLREFADAMEADQSVEWWRDYEWKSKLGDWRQCDSELRTIEIVLHHYPIRRRPRTVTLYDRNGKEVELPDGAIYGGAAGGYTFTMHFSAPTQADAQAWATHFRSLLEANDHD